jgi:DNA-binding beta-propeller fold protein YncE
LDDRRFDELSRRVGVLALPRLPRRGLMGLLGGATLAGALGVALEPQPAEAAKCKDEGKKCDKKKCKKCCCNDLKCKQGRCEPKGGSCRTDVADGTAFPPFDADPNPDSFNDPFGITTDPDGDVYVTDTGNDRVLIFNASGALIGQFGTSGNEDDEFLEPLGIAFGLDDQDRDRVYVADPDQSLSQRLRRFRVSGVNEGNLGEGDLDDPVGVAVDSEGNIWLADFLDGEIFLFGNDGDLITSWTPGGDGDLSLPEGIALFEENNRTFVYVADTGNNRIVKFEYVDNSANGLKFVDEAGSFGSTNERFDEPVGIAIDSCGNLWVADRDNNRIQQLDKDLNFESRFDDDGFNGPTGVALSPNGRSLYVVYSSSDQVVRYPLS